MIDKLRKKDESRYKLLDLDYVSYSKK